MIIIRDDLSVVNEDGQVIGRANSPKLRLETHRDYIMTYEIYITSQIILDASITDEAPKPKERAIKLC